jgi:hypothetical protein
MWAALVIGLFSGFCIGHRIGVSRCDHFWGWYKNTHGDEINHVSYRTVFKCEKCGKYKYYPDFISKSMAIRVHSSVALSDIRRTP